jgi:hypothetical protein
VDVPELESISVGERVMGMEVTVSASLLRTLKLPLSGLLVLKPHDFEGVGRGEVCGLLIGRLQDVSARLCCIHCLVV